MGLHPSQFDDHIEHYINEHLNADLKSLVFKKSPFNQVTMPELVTQISGKKTAQKKIPTWFNTPGIIYPPKRNLEQASSELTANYKAGLMQGEFGADITGGYGIDSFFIAQNFNAFDYFEHQQALFQLATHNFKQLKSPIKTNNLDGVSGIQHKQYDWIYCDPDRRSSGQKAFRLNQCEPDLTTTLPLIMRSCKQLLIKTSPILDINQALKDVPGIQEIHAVAASGELKELLFVVGHQHVENPKLYALNLFSDHVKVFTTTWGNHPKIGYSLPKEFLFIPNAAIMKLQHFGALGLAYNLHKLHEHSHFYTAVEPIAFPGRIFKILAVLEYNKATMSSLKGSSALIISRNFPLSVADLRKRWKLSDQGSSYLIFTTLMDQQKVVLKCELI